jgi:hypothetical protein
MVVIKKIMNFLCFLWQSLFIKFNGLLIMVLVFLQTTPLKILASDTDPFGNMDITPDQLENTSGSTVGTTMEFILVAFGVLGCATCVTNIIRALNRSADDKQEHGGSVKTIFYNIAGIIISLTIVALGWKGAAYLAHKK